MLRNSVKTGQPPDEWTYFSPRGHRLGNRGEHSSDNGIHPAPRHGNNVFKSPGVAQLIQELLWGKPSTVRQNVSEDNGQFVPCPRIKWSGHGEPIEDSQTGLDLIHIIAGRHSQTTHDLKGIIRISGHSGNPVEQLPRPSAQNRPLSSSRKTLNPQFGRVSCQAGSRGGDGSSLCLSKTS